MNKVGQPIIHKDAYTRAIEDELLAWMNEAIFAPLRLDLENFNIALDPKFQAIKYDEFGKRLNAIGAVEQALRSGQIHWADGVFSGKFNSAISRELREMGATFNAEAKTFALPVSKLPHTLRGTIADSLAQSTAAHDAVLSTLSAIQENAAKAAAGLKFTKAIDLITGDLGAQFVRTVTGFETVSLQPDITPDLRERLTAELTENLDIGIKRFAQERIPEMRRRVEENVFKGMRSDRLAKILESEFGVAKRKANFLADQETGLLTSKYRQARYESIGVREYIWQTSNDARVRHDHAELAGRRFSFSSPPVTDHATGRRNNPGEDHRCRCVPRPVINVATAA